MATNFTNWKSSGFHYITVEEIKVKLGEFWMKISVIFTKEEHKIKENVLLLIFNDSISKIKWHNPWRFQKYMRAADRGLFA